MKWNLVKRTAHTLCPYSVWFDLLNYRDGLSWSEIWMKEVCLLGIRPTPHVLPSGGDPEETPAPEQRAQFISRPQTLHMVA